MLKSLSSIKLNNYKADLKALKEKGSLFLSEAYSYDYLYEENIPGAKYKVAYWNKVYKKLQNIFVLKFDKSVFEEFGITIQSAVFVQSIIDDESLCTSGGTPKKRKIRKKIRKQLAYIYIYMQN